MKEKVTSLSDNSEVEAAFKLLKYVHQLLYRTLPEFLSVALRRIFYQRAHVAEIFASIPQVGQFGLSSFQQNIKIGATMCRRLIALLFLNLSCFSYSARADLLTDPSQLSSGNTFVDFEGLTVGNVGSPLTIGDATFSSSVTLSIFDTTPYTPPPLVFRNVLMSSPSLFAAPWVNIRIDFATPVSEVGFGWWDTNIGGNELQVFNSSNSLLEAASIPAGSIGGGFAAFRGIRRSTNEISYAVAQVAGPSELFGIDNVSFGITAVPEPSSAMLLGCSTIAWLSLYRRKTRVVF